MFDAVQRASVTKRFRYVYEAGWMVELPDPQTGKRMLAFSAKPPLAGTAGHPVNVPPWRETVTGITAQQADSPEELFVKGYPVTDREGVLEARKHFHFHSGVRFGVGTANEFGRLMGMLERREYADSSVCEEALRILAMQTSTSRIPRYLPASTIVRHKAGDFAPFIANDVGIVTPWKGSPIILSMFSQKNTKAWGFAEEVMSRVALGCFEYFAEHAN